MTRDFASSDHDFNDRFLADLRSAIDIVEVISDSVALKKSGKAWKGLCPFHGEKTPSFQVDRDKGFYYCFGCGVGGDALKFVIETEKIAFPEACERLARRFHVPIPPKKVARTKERDRADLLRQIVLRTHQIFREEFRRSESPALEYVRGRGLSDEAIEEFGFGWAPDRWDRVVGGLSKEFGDAALEEAGVAIRHAEKGTYYDRFRGRVMVPIPDGEGRIVAFGGRILGAGEPKYLNSPETPIFAKSRLLFNAYRAKPEIRKRDQAILVEGYFDAITLVAGGIPNVVASLGTSFTEGHADFLRRMSSRVVILYDGDDAGRNAAVRAIPILLAKDLQVRVVELPAGDDPDSFLGREGKPALDRLVSSAREPVEFLLSREADLKSPAGRRAAADRVLEILRAHPDRVFRYASVEQLAERLGLPANLLWEKLPDRRQGVDSAQVKATTVQTGSNLSGERRLLRLMVDSVAFRRAASESLETRDLSNSDHQIIFETLIRSDFLDQNLDFRSIIDHLNRDSAVAALSAIAFEEGPQGQPGELEGLVALLQKRTLERLSEALQGEIHRFQSTDEDPARLDALLKAKLELGRRIGQKGRPPKP